MKKIFTTLLMVLGMSATAAFATPITMTAGDVLFTFNIYATGTGSYPTTTNGILCNSIAACDAIPGQVAAPDAFGDDIWGIFSIASISNISTGDTFWTRGLNGQYLTGLFGGMQDAALEVTGSALGGEKTTDSYTTGGYMNMYYNTADYDPTLSTTGRTSEFAFTGITSGDLALSAVFAGSAAAGLPYSYVASTKTQSMSGTGKGFMDVTGGSMYGDLNTNSMTDTQGNGRDLYFDVVYNDSNGVATSIGWDVAGAGTVRGKVQTVSEPGTLALMGLGLMGLAGIARRKIK